jgi:hypothetical protein
MVSLLENYKMAPSSMRTSPSVTSFSIRDIEEEGFSLSIQPEFELTIASFYTSQQKEF